MILGYPILGGLDDVEALVARYGVTQIVLADPLDAERLRRLLEITRRLGVRLLRREVALAPMEAARSSSPPAEGGKSLPS